MGRRVLLVSSNSSGQGGGERYLVYLARGLRLLGCEVHALLSTVEYMDGLAADLADEGAEVQRRRLAGLHQRPLRFVQSIAARGQQREVARACEAVAPDAILVNQQYDEDSLDYLAGALMARVAPVGGTMHMPMTATKNLRPLGKARGRVLEAWYRRHPYRLIFVSQGAHEEFHGYYDVPFQTRVVHCGCPFDDAENGNGAVGIEWGAAGPVVGFSGQFVAQKNLPLLLDSWLYARSRGADARLLLVGDGPERAAVEERLRREAPHGTWHVTGWQKNPERFLREIDLYVMTSHFEGLPLALLEAAGRGIPCVVTDFNGASDTAERAAWVRVVGERTAEGVGETMLRALSELGSLKQAAADGKAEFQRYFSPERMAADTLAALGMG